MAKKPEKIKMPKKEATPSFFRAHFFEIIIVGFCFLLYSNSLFNDYNMDDELVTRNHRLTSKGISAIPEIFTSPYYQDEMGYAYEYRPVVLASFAIEHSLFGDSAPVSHFFNLLFYALLCVCIFWLIVSLGGMFTPLMALIITLIFSAHPSHTEVVCSIKNRDEILGLLFCVLAMQKALTATRKKQIWLLLASAILFLLALLCKNTFVPFAFFIPLAIILFTESTVVFTIGVALLLSLASYFALDISQAHYKLWFVFFLISGVALAHLLVNGLPSKDLVSFFKIEESHTLSPEKEGVFSGLKQWFSAFNKTSFYSLLPTAVILFIYLFWCIHTWWFLLVILLVLFGSIYLEYSNFKYWNLSLGLLLCIAVLAIEILWRIKFGWIINIPPQLRMLNILFLFLFVWGSHSVRLPSIAIACVMNYFLPSTLLQGDLVFILLTFVFGRMIVGRKLLLVFLLLLATSVIISCVGAGVSGLFGESGISLILQFTLVLLLLNLGGSWTYLLNKKNFVFAIILLLMSSFFAYQFTYQIKQGITHAVYNDKDYLNVVKTVVDTKTDRPLSYVEYPLPPGTSIDIKVGTSLVVLGHYLKKTVLPYPLSFYYGYAFIKPTKMNELAPIIIGIIYLLILIAALIFLKKDKSLSFSLIVYFVSVLVFSGYFISVPGIVADRYLLVPSLGWSMLLVLLVWKIGKANHVIGNTDIHHLRFSHLPKGVTYSLAIVLCFYSCLTFGRNFDWKDDLTLFRQDIKYVNSSSQAHNLLAIHLMKHSFDVNDLVKQKEIRNEALLHFKAAIEIYPSFYNVAFDLGRTYAALNMPDSALLYFNRAISIDSGNSDAHLLIAKMLWEARRYEESVPYFEFRIRNVPADYYSYGTLSYIYFSLKEYQKSIGINTIAAKQFPAIPDPLANIGRTYMAMNEKDSARVYFEKALVVRPNDAGILQLLQQVAVK